MLLNQKNNIFQNSKFAHSFENFDFMQIQNENEINEKVSQQISELNFITFNSYSYKNENLFIICFENQMFFIDQGNVLLIQAFFSNFDWKKTTIFSLPNSEDKFKHIFDQNYKKPEIWNNIL